MSTLDRYLLKNTLKTWLASLASLALLLLVSRLLGDISTFIEHDVSLSLAGAYLLLSLPQMITLILPFTVCLGILAAQASFARHVETIAMQASGVGARHLSRPYLMVGLIATVCMVAFSGFLAPRAQWEAERIEDAYIKNRDVEGNFTVEGGRFKIGGDIYLVEHLDIEAGTMDGVVCYRTADGRLGEIWRTPRAAWNGGAWQAGDLEVVQLGDEGITVRGGEQRLPLDRRPDALVMAQARPDVLEIHDLKRYNDRLKNSGIASASMETCFQSRVSFMFAPLIMTLLVLPFGRTFPRTGGIARGITLGLALGMAYWGLHSAMTALSARGLVAPVVGAWTANVVAVIGALILYRLKRGTYG